MAADSFEKISAGEVASIENTRKAPLSISITCDNGCTVNLDLLQGQILGFAAGEATAELVLHNGDVAGLLVIKPALAS